MRQHIFHTAAFKLKNAVGIAGGDHVIDRFVIVIDLLDAEIRLPLTDHHLRVVDNGQVAQPEEIHL